MTQDCGAREGVSVPVGSARLSIPGPSILHLQTYFHNKAVDWESVSLKSKQNTKALPPPQRREIYPQARSRHSRRVSFSVSRFSRIIFLHPPFRASSCLPLTHTRVSGRGPLQGLGSSRMEGCRNRRGCTVLVAAEHPHPPPSLLRNSFDKYLLRVCMLFGPWGESSERGSGPVLREGG